MKCPSCRSIASNTISPTEDLTALICSKCEGYWIRSEEYWKWKEKHPEIMPEKTDDEISELPVEDSSSAKICPECNKILLRYEVGHATGLTLDRCHACGGTWFDKNEWETLKGKNLHDEIHFIFSAPWQNRVKQDKQQHVMENRVKEILGEEDYSEAKRVKNWIANHEKSAEILAYLRRD